MGQYLCFLETENSCLTGFFCAGDGSAGAMLPNGIHSETGDPSPNVAGRINVLRRDGRWPTRLGLEDVTFNFSGVGRNLRLI